MKCLLCEQYALTHICKECQKLHLLPSRYKRKIQGKVKVYSFYRYKDIEPLLFTKHTDLGYYIYSILASVSFAIFAKELEIDGDVAVIAVDDRVKNGYSHTSILASSMQKRALHYRVAALRDYSNTVYSGKNFQYRLLHPREFVLKEFKERKVILVDDILTTGLTLTAAINSLKEQNKEVLFCLTLADAQGK